MYQIEISPINAYDDGKYFNNWLKENYSQTTAIIPDVDSDKLTLNFSEALDIATETAIISFYQGIDEAGILPTLKILKEQEIDGNTQQVILIGIEYDVNQDENDQDIKTFSLSLIAQHNADAIGGNFSDNVIQYGYQNDCSIKEAYEAVQLGMYVAGGGVRVSTTDGKYHTFLDHSTLMAFKNFLFAHVESVYNDGQDLREQIENATTILELDAIQDPRV